MLNVKSVIESYTSVEPFGDNEEMVTTFLGGGLCMEIRERIVEEEESDDL